MGIWNWLNANAGAIQSIAALLVAVLAVVVIIVLIVTRGAIKAHAEATARAASDVAECAELQAELLASQIELSTAPFLVSELSPGYINPAQIVVNRGAGIAFHVRYWHGTRDLVERQTVSFTQPSTLAPGSNAELHLEDRWASWTISYKGGDGQERWTIAYRDREKPQEHIVRRGGKEVRFV